MAKLTLFCFRDHDLRLADNPALSKAIEHAEATRSQLALCVCLDQETLNSAEHAIDIAQRKAIIALAQKIRALDGHLNISANAILDTVNCLQARHTLTGVFWSRRYLPSDISADAQLKQNLQQADIPAFSRNAALLFEPFDARALKNDATPYKVYTPYSKKCLVELESISKPLSPPTTLTQAIDLGLSADHAQPSVPNWAHELSSHWTFSEQQAHRQINDWLEHLSHYKQQRNMPALKNGTSKLSPYLRLGLCSPKQILHAIISNLDSSDHLNPEQFNESTLIFIKEILWREFAYYTLYHFPDTLTRPFKSKFTQFPWHKPNNDEADLQAWQQGRTGVPIVDAGMRELWHTGWMHNRVRMIVASWLSKNMGIHWHLGAQWFMHTLVDADMASNTLGWQWVAGCGVDAAPYFRVFNPILQAKKFDPDAEYVKKWLPALRDLPVQQCFEPWLHHDGIQPPIVDIRTSRESALNRYKRMQNIS